MKISYQATSNQALHTHRKAKEVSEKMVKKGKDTPTTYSQKITDTKKTQITPQKRILMNSNETPACPCIKWKGRSSPSSRSLPVMLGSRLRPLWSLQWTRAASKSHWPNRLRMLLTFGRAGAGRGRDSQLLWLGLDNRVGEEEVCCCCCCWDALVG